MKSEVDASEEFDGKNLARIVEPYGKVRPDGIGLFLLESCSAVEPDGSPKAREIASCGCQKAGIGPPCIKPACEAALRKRGMGLSSMSRSGHSDWAAWES
eukprot:CAMPEP_0119344592 /NCGR_PEP_ID=MMETSP1333-20130426/107049_1 /TAXON_ID=418940 /ORGANISM="Scyphosphaera apsteinii, Strain RCC1455" /LENGTH=99 /DNA_ID=CAMNT_0007357031 /DNA_START=613 /DNA_END=912 /DNA_ORIENTATION=+